MRDIPFGKPLLQDAEKKAVLEVMDSGILAHGKRINEFEAAFAGFAGAPECVGVASCTAALHLFYFNFNISAGDEVIVPAQTHTATAHAVELAGATPVFVDAERKTGNIDIEQIEEKITDRTRAISVVHFLGMPVEMDRVNDIARKHELLVLEDCALAIGSFYKGVHAGLHGDAGCFSFYPVKHMTTAEGGVLLSKDPGLAKAIRIRRAFGMDKHVGERKLPGMYDVQYLGFNYRMNEIQAAIGIEQVRRLKGILAARETNYEGLTRGLKEIDEVDILESTNAQCQSSYYCHTMILKPEITGKRFDIINLLKSKGVGTSIYYPHPVPKMTYYVKKYGYEDDSFPNATWISENSIALPVGPHLVEGDTGYIVEAIKQVISEVKK